MIRATVTMLVRRGAEAAFVEAWCAIADVVRRTPGNIAQALVRDPARPRRFVISSDWTSAEAFRCFEQSAEQDRLTAPLRALRESSTMSIDELVAHVAHVERTKEEVCR